MHNLPIVVQLACFNEAAFIEQSIRSVINYINKVIVIEGSWLSCAKTCGLKRSNDGTIDILYRLRKEFGDKISIYHLNEPTQLDQRNKYFELCQYAHDMLILDGDEVYQPEEIEKVVAATKRTDFEVFKTTSLTFVNDAHHYTPIDFPRLFRIDGPGYRFTDPNTLIKPDGSEQTVCQEPVAEFLHFSYLNRSPGRMQQKINDRIATHSEFAWELHGDYIKRREVSEKLLYTDKIPEIVKDHPLLQTKAPQEAFQYKEPEKIGFLINSGLGNLVIATPMLRALRTIKPEARISVLTWERGSDIIQGWDAVNEVVTQNHAQFLYSIGGLDYLLVSPTAHIRYPGVFELSKNLVLPQDKGGVWGKSEAQYNLDLIRQAFGYDGPTPQPECFLTQENYEDAKILTGSAKDYIVVAAGYLKEGHWALKHWGNDNYAKLLPFLAQYGPIVMVGDKDDREDAKEILEKSGIAGLNCCGCCDIKTSSAIIAQAKSICGNDGGLLHIASCFRIPTLAIWTFTSLLKNLPLNPNLKVAALPCDKRNICQHGFYHNCESKVCKNVPIELVVSKFQELIS